MTKIEDALRKIQRSHPALASAPAGASSDSTLAKRKAVIAAKKHHVSPEDLMRGGLLAPLEGAGTVADQFRRIKRPIIANAVLKNSPGEHMNVLMIASALPSAGKTFCSVNLALSISLERELNVVLVDADVAKPHISRAFGLADSPGLIDLLLDGSLDVGSMLVRTDLNDVQVLSAGRRHPHATELLASERMSRLVHELATRYPDRLIVLDSPPLLMTSEAQALASQVGQIALVVEAGQTSRQVLTQAIELLDRNKAINLILNKAHRWSEAYYDGEYPHEAHPRR